jgi:hypothetical protein
MQLRHFFENSAIPTVMEHYRFAKEKHIREILKWQYAERAREGQANALLVKLLEVSNGVYWPHRDSPSFTSTTVSSKQTLAFP